MRPKVVFAVLLLAVGLLGMAALVSMALRPQSPDRLNPRSAESTSPEKAPPAAGSSAIPRVRDSRASRPVPALSAAPSAVMNSGLTNAAAEDPAQARYVRQRIAELDALAMNNDAASRDGILAELQNPDKAIRKAALEAAIQFGDRSVVPRLQEIADQTDDPAEKAEILAAIDYIKLPSLTEYLAERRTRLAAMGQTNLPQPPPDRMGRPSHRPSSQSTQPTQGNQ